MTNKKVISNQYHGSQMCIKYIIIFLGIGQWHVYKGRTPPFWKANSRFCMLSDTCRETRETRCTTSIYY